MKLCLLQGNCSSTSLWHGCPGLGCLSWIACSQRAGAGRSNTGGTHESLISDSGHAGSSCSEAIFPILAKDGGGFVAQCPVCEEALMKRYALKCKLSNR